MKMITRNMKVYESKTINGRKNKVELLKCSRKEELV